MLFDDIFERRRYFRLPASLILAMIPLVLAHLFFTPRWATNDDYGYDIALRGIGASGTGSPFILFSNILFTWPLYKLYSILPNFAWYYWAHGLLHFVASWLLAFLCLSVARNHRHLALVICYFLTIDTSFYVTPQFTVTSLLLSQSAGLLWLSGITSASHSSYFRTVAIATLFLMASLVRLEGPILVVAILIPLGGLGVFWRTCDAGQTKSTGTRRMAQVITITVSVYLPLLIAMSLAIGAKKVNDIIYDQQPQYRQFAEFNALRCQFNDYHLFDYGPKTQPAYDAANWSENDYRLLMNWIFVDETVYSTSKMQLIADNIGESGKTIHPEDIYGLVRLAHVPLYRVCIILTVLMAFIVHKSQRSFLVINVTATVLVCVWIAMKTFLHLPERVMEPTLALLVAIALTRPSRPQQTEEILSPFAFSMGAVVSLFLLFDLYNHAVWASAMNEKKNAVQARLTTILETMRERKDATFLVVGATLPLEVLPAGSPSEIAGLDFILLGAGTRTCWGKERMQQSHIEDCYAALYENSNVFLVSLGHVPQMLAHFIKEHRDVKVTYRRLLWTNCFVGEDSGVFQFHRLPDMRKQKDLMTIVPLNHSRSTAE